MKKFISKILVFSAFAFLFIWAVLKFYGGSADYFYVKFTSSHQHSMVLGDSRSFHGIQPRIMNKNLSGFDLPVFNYSFTIAQIAYGDAYLNSIKKKIDPETKNGLFVLTVHPAVLAEREDDNVNDNVYFEADMPPHNMKFVSMDPNIEYFFRNFSYFHFRAIFRQVSTVHDDGWMELKSAPSTPKEIAQATNDEYKRYEGFYKKWKKSNYRLAKLQETVSFLKQHGTVVLLRMPCNPEIIALENDFWRNFDQDMQAMASAQDVEFINYTAKENTFTLFDGIHLTKNSGERFTKSLCDSIMSRTGKTLSVQTHD